MYELKFEIDVLAKSGIKKAPSILGALNKLSFVYLVKKPTLNPAVKANGISGVTTKPQ